MELLCKEFGNNHEIIVYDTEELYGEKGSFRVLEFSNEAIQGAKDLDHPERIVFEYPRAMIHLMEHNNPSFQDAFLIGHGIGTMAGYFSEKTFKVAELNGKVVELSRRYFGYAKDNVMIGDGRTILSNEPPQAYDYIIVDAFTDKGTPQHLISREFFDITREKLDDGGALLMNLMGKGEHDRLINAIHTTLCKVFTYTKTFALPSERAGDMLNIVMIGSAHSIGFQARKMAGFTEIVPGQGHLIMDSRP